MRWLNASHVMNKGLWQRAIDDKLLGYVFARAHGVPTPSVLFCDPRGPPALPERWPEEWGCCFAIKPLYGYADFGIMLVEHNVDRFSGAVLRGRDDVMRFLRTQGVPRLHRRTVYVETIIRPEAALYGRNATPPDFKFMMFGSTIGSVAIIEARKTRNACMAWVDEDFKRTDLHGCVCREIGGDSPCLYKHCDKGLPPKPQRWHEMVGAAKKLGKIVGVHMRVDLFAGKTGGPVLGEFTPWHANGKMHCDLRPVAQSDSWSAAAASIAPKDGSKKKSSKDHDRVAGALRRRDGLSGETHTVDVCAMGRMWQEHGREEGGPHNPMPPPVLRGWPALMYNEQAKCLAAVRLLKPA